ncbi:alkaline phosphatase family protein [Pseudarthrobacter sp. NPDC058119]|uniref:alkaline phosphatase family protein n=1 Tax=Pseudarthrobacter sp. NPDC058119 TaxID=3346348 RepID=UPI0036DF1EF3
MINLENKGYDEVWGSKSRAPYLSTTLRQQGVLLSNYYGIAHNSLPNYLAQISGQPPNSSTEEDCPTYTRFRSSKTDSQGKLLGTGCVYPGNVQTIASQLTDAGKTWKAYMEDMSPHASTRPWTARTKTQKPPPGTNTRPAMTRSSTSNQ